MAEDLFDIRIDDLGNLIAAFETMAADADDLRGALLEAGRTVQERTMHNYFNEGIDTDFGFWIMLSPAYHTWKEANYPGRRTLQLHDPSPLESAVIDPAAVHMESEHEVWYVIRDEKAGWHQFGADRSKGGLLPPRPIIPDVGDVEPHIRPIFEDWVVEVIDHGQSRVRDMPWTPQHPWFRPRSSIGTFLPFS